MLQESSLCIVFNGLCKNGRTGGLSQAASLRAFFTTQIPTVSPLVCRCEHPRSYLICLFPEGTIIPMVVKSKCLLVAVSRVAVSVGNPEARWAGVTHAKRCRGRYDRVEWWADAAMKQILVDQVVPSVRLGDVGFDMRDKWRSNSCRQ